MNRKSTNGHFCEFYVPKILRHSWGRFHNIRVLYLQNFLSKAGIVLAMLAATLDCTLWLN